MTQDRQGLENAHRLKESIVSLCEGHETPEVMTALTLVVTEAIVNGYKPHEWLEMLGLLATHALKSMSAPVGWETRDGMPLVRVLQ
jgi:hypothetical protein